MIDETTGMPELPEGMAWKVEEEKYASGNTLKVILCARGMVEVEVETTEVSTRKFWFSKPKTELRTTYEEVESWVPAGYSGSLREVRYPPDDEALPEGFRPIHDRWEGRLAVRYLDPTPENIRAVALKVWAEYEEAQAKKAEAARQAEVRKTLVGMYPPKKMEG